MRGTCPYLVVIIIIKRRLISRRNMPEDITSTSSVPLYACQVCSSDAAS